jgi:ADP-ribose pyrophosphatase
LVNSRPFTTLSSRYLWQSQWYNVRQDQVRLLDGREVTYTVIDKPPAVWIVPITVDGQLVLIEQYRYTIQDWCLEVPAGSGEPGVEPLDLAIRELREEIGGTAQQIVPIHEFYLSTGLTNGRGQVFLALGVTLGATQHEATEYIKLHPVPVEEALHMARTGVIKAGPSALAILLSEAAIRAYWTEQQA